MNSVEAYSSITVNSLLTNCIKYDPSLAGPVAKTLNLSGLSLFDINGFNNTMEGMRQLIRCDINGITAGYSSFTVLIDRLATSHIWASDRFNLATATQIYTNTAETNFITATELQNLKNSSSNLQEQLDLKLTVGTTLAVGQTGKSISIDIINPITGSTFQGGNKIMLNAQEVQCPYRLAVTDLIYTGDIYIYILIYQ